MKKKEKSNKPDSKKKKNVREKVIPVLAGLGGVYLAAAFFEPIISWLLIKIVPGANPELIFRFIFLSIDTPLTSINRYSDIFVLSAFMPSLIILIESSGFLANEKSPFSRRVPVMVFQLIVNLYMIILVLRGIIIMLLDVSPGSGWSVYVSTYKPDLEEKLMTALALLFINFIYFGWSNARIRKYMTETN